MFPEPRVERMRLQNPEDILATAFCVMRRSNKAANDLRLR
jgi:hypothetical protein